jgi:hypothetical protein
MPNAYTQNSIVAICAIHAGRGNPFGGGTCGCLIDAVEVAVPLMPVERRVISSSQFCELLGIDEARFRGVEWGEWVQVTDRPDGRMTSRPNVVVLLEPEEAGDGADERHVPAAH